MLRALPILACSPRLFAQTSSTLIPVLGLHQVTLAVSDVGRSLEFYQGLFGLPVQARHGTKVLLRLGDGPHFLALTEAGSGPPRFDHFGMAVEDFDADRVLEMLANHGVGEADSGGGLRRWPASRSPDHPREHRRSPYGRSEWTRHSAAGSEVLRWERVDW